jgi:histidinol-phosphate aminotransferase
LLFAAAAVIEQLMKVKDSYNVNAITQALGRAALEDGAHHGELVRKTLAERARLEQGLAALGFTWPESAANFLLCEAPGGDEDPGRAEAIYRGLKQRGILVRWWSSPELRSRLRITVGQPGDNDRLVEELRRLV